MKIENGEVFGCGFNDDGQLGVGDTTLRREPVKIGIDGVIDIACGYVHSMLLTGKEILN